MKSSQIGPIFAFVINVLFIGLSITFVIYMVNLGQHQATAKKIPEEKPAALKVEINTKTTKTELEIIHGTHYWTLQNIFALESTEVNEVSSQPFKVVFRRGDNEFTYK